MKREHGEKERVKESKQVQVHPVKSTEDGEVEEEIKRMTQSGCNSRSIVAGLPSDKNSCEYLQNCSAIANAIWC